MNFFDLECADLHGERDQLRRQKSALNLEMASVDCAAKAGTIKNYAVTLENCTCTDFSRRQKPCKHMYCLARALGVFDFSAEKIEAAERDGHAEKIVLYPVSYARSMKIAPPKNFVVIDFETANAQPDSVCQIGIVVVENDSIAEKASFLIRPPYENFSNSKIHGLTLKDVENAPDFSQLWPEIKKYFSGRIIAAYNLPFDLGCLYATLERYGIDRPSFEAFDILVNVRHYANSCGDSEISGLSSFRLANVAKALKLAHNAHEALSDATVTAEIQIYFSARFPEEKISAHFIDASANGAR